MEFLPNGIEDFGHSLDKVRDYLQEELARNEALIDELKSKILKIFKNENKSLTSDLKKAEEKIEQLEKERKRLVGWQDKYKYLEENSEIFKKELEVNKKKIKDLNGVISERNNDLEREKNTFIKTIEIERDRSKAEMSALNIEISDLKTSKKILENNEQQLVKKEEKLTKEIKDLNDQIFMMEVSSYTGSDDDNNLRPEMETIPRVKELLIKRREKLRKLKESKTNSLIEGTNTKYLYRQIERTKAFINLLEKLSKTMEEKEALTKGNSFIENLKKEIQEKKDELEVMKKQLIEKVKSNVRGFSSYGNNTYNKEKTKEKLEELLECQDAITTLIAKNLVAIPSILNIKVKNEDKKDELMDKLTKKTLIEMKEIIAFCKLKEEIIKKEMQLQTELQKAIISITN
ncbi:MAG: Chromosome partition protein Smc [Mycoplasmataceae bacterium]|nr:MAG: Chromosome partition protein Smc [Mycoplasmataceae bacterium]